MLSLEDSLREMETQGFSFHEQMVAAIHEGQAVRRLPTLFKVQHIRNVKRLNDPRNKKKIKEFPLAYAVSLTLDSSVASGNYYYGSRDFCSLLNSSLEPIKHTVQQNEPTTEWPDTSSGVLWLEDPILIKSEDSDFSLDVRMFTWGGADVSPGVFSEIPLGGRVSTNFIVGKDSKIDRAAAVAGSVFVTDHQGYPSTIPIFWGPAVALTAAIRILHQPGLITVEEKMPSEIEVKRARKKRQAPPETVKVIDLRTREAKAQQAAVEAAEARGREYSHRWVVRGHWRNQAHGPGRKQRRPIFIAPYVKGPDGKPLLAKDTVYRW